MSRHPSLAELTQLDMGLTACAVFVALVLGVAVVSVVIEQTWLGLRRLWNLRKDRSNGR